MLAKMTTQQNLDRELATYARELPSLLKDEGRYALIAGDAVLGVFESYNDALARGYEIAKTEPFLVKKISAVETIAYFSREFV